MAIKKLDHVSILSKNPQPVIDFYKEILGFEVVSQREVKEMFMNIYDLKVREEHVEIIQPTSADIKMTDGIKHVAFLTDDVDGEFERISATGAKMLHKEVQRHGNTSFFFVKSPSGEFVEIIQYS